MEPRVLQQVVSAREAEVLAGVAEHMTNAEIGASLFISIRTVESHVAALLRKLGARDRRALAGMAAELRPASVENGGARTGPRRTSSWPSPLTSFIGRVDERAALADALRQHRLVTAVGPGGVGKTRLAQAVAADLNDRYADGAWYVDLVPVTDAAMVAPSLAVALGLGEQHGRLAVETVRDWIGDRHMLVVLDNCEHVVDGVVLLVELLLTECPELVILATSRARLLVPYEWVFTVAGLSVVEHDGVAGDAVTLFLARAVASGSAVASIDPGEVGTVCRELDGVALAIELAAARLPTLGMDGVRNGLADQLRLLTGGRRIDGRHESVRSTLDWSYALLSDAQKAILRRVAVFAGPFAVDEALAVFAGVTTVASAEIATGLAALADQSLLVASAGSTATRYRALETIRQYAADQLAATGELVDAHGRHLRWCLNAGNRLRAGLTSDSGAWRAAFDLIVDELRSALSWSELRPEWRTEAYRLAVCLAELAYVRGMPAESQRRYEQAAVLASVAGDEAVAWHCAAGAAATRHDGDAALRLHRAAADAALRGGDTAAAARELAQSAEFINRAVGLITHLPSSEDVDALLAEARLRSGGDALAEARIRTAEAFRGPESDPATGDLTEQAVLLARHAGDPLVESAALDQLTCVQLALGRVRTAADHALRRVELLATLSGRVDAGLELSDALCMATETAVAAGDLRAARTLAGRVRDLPFYREEGHLATARLLVVTALTGDWDQTVALAERYLEGWQRAGRPRDGNLNRGAYAAATVFGLRGDDASRDAWIEVVNDLVAPDRATRAIECYEFFDAMLMLHRGQPEQALARLARPPDEFREWHSGLWRPWYAALWAEAAVLAGDPNAEDRLRRATVIAADNPVAAAIVDRAAAMADGEQRSLLPIAAALDAAGCRYQHARTLIFAGGSTRTRGEAMMAAIGATAIGAGAGGLTG